MPELPEVETILNKLRPRILNATIARITTRRKDLRFPFPKNFATNLKGQKILKLSRRSKYLLLDLANHKTLIIHLGMTGRLYICDKDRPLQKHDHVLFDFDDNLHLRFLDPRRFGFMDIEDTGTLAHSKFFKHLGVEPLNPKFTADTLHTICQSSTSPIKATLMNAKHIVGVGNIYACESLFLAGISPDRNSNSVSRLECDQLVKAIKGTLTKSIKAGGTSFRDYVDVDEKPGLHQISLNVYGREGLPCCSCKNTIKRMQQSNRSTFYCSHCQK